MKDQISILILISALILVGIIFLIVKSLASKPILFPKIPFPSRQTIAKEWLIFIAAISLGLLLNLLLNWRLYEHQVSASQAWQKKMDAAIGFIPDKAKSNPVGVESAPIKTQNKGYEVIEPEKPTEIPHWESKTNVFDDLIPKSKRANQFDVFDTLPPEPPKPEFYPLETQFIFLVMFTVYFIRSIAWSVTILKIKKNNLK